MQKGSEDIVFRLKLSQFVFQWLGMRGWIHCGSGTKNLEKQSEL
jgi:hypothetical protein